MIQVFTTVNSNPLSCIVLQYLTNQRTTQKGIEHLPISKQHISIHKLKSIYYKRNNIYILIEFASCWLNVVLKAPSNPSTCLGSLPLIQKNPPPSFVDQFLLFMPNSNKRPPPTCLLMTILPRQLDFILFLNDCCKFVPALG